MKAYEVDAVVYEGSVAVLFAHDAAGGEVAIAAEPRMARDIEAALDMGRRPVVDVEPWQVMYSSPIERRVAR